MDDQTQLEILIEALERIKAAAPEQQPEEETYDDTESAYSNGAEVAAWEAGEIARKALEAINGDVPEPDQHAPRCRDCNEPRTVHSENWQQWCCACCGSWNDKPNAGVNSHA